jgi:hypothetical protein
MYLVIAKNWQKDIAEVAQAIADTLEILIFEARQKITGGLPVTVANFSDRQQAEVTAAQLAERNIAPLIVDTVDVRNKQSLFQVSQFKLEPHTLQVESAEGELLEIDYANLELLLLATGSDGQIETMKTTTSRKFSMGKTLLAGGIPMTKKVKKTEIKTSSDREKTLWLYSDRDEIVIFNLGKVNYSGLGEKRDLTRDLNFTHLRNELLRLAPHACYDERLLKRAGQVNLLGPALDPETHLDLAFEILAQSLKSYRVPHG